MKNSINRRQALTGVAAIATGATIATAASAQTVGPDQELNNLFDRWIKLERAILDATEKSDSAEFAARKEYPDQPECLKTKNGFDTVVMNTREDFDRNHDLMQTFYPACTHEAIEAMHKATMSIYDKWETEIDRINQRHNLPALEQARTGFIAERETVERQLIETPSKSVTGVLVKLSFWSHLNLDIEVMGEEFSGEQPTSQEYAIRAAHTDLQRLTGLSFTTTV